MRSRSAAGTPGPRSTTRTSTPSPADAGDDAHRACRPARVVDRVRDHVRERALEQRPGRRATRGWRLVDVDVDAPRPAGPRLASAAGITSSTPTGGEADVERAGLEPAHVEQVADEGVEAVGLLVDRDEELVLLVRRPRDVVLEQARHRGLDPRERRAEVVRDRGEDRRPELARGGEVPGRRRLVLQPLDGERRRDLARERVEDAAAGARADRPAHGDEHVLVRRLDACGSSPGADGIGPPAACSTAQPRRRRPEHATASSPSSRRRLSSRSGTGCRARELGERLGLGAVARALGGPPRGERRRTRSRPRRRRGRPTARAGSRPRRS